MLGVQYDRARRPATTHPAEEAPVRTLDVRTTRRAEFVEITADVRRAVADAGLRDGVCVVYCPHTTAAVTIQENADPDVVHDLLLWLNHHIPKDVSGFRHAEGNSDAHIKSSLVGPAVTVLVAGGQLVLGTWQGIYFCEFDGPRRRSVQVQTIGNNP
jgi:secondary thiamine-phosphate synthase enzyme